MGNLFGEEATSKKVRVPIERKVANLVLNLKFAKKGRSDGWINRDSYPLLSRATEISKFPPDTIEDEYAGVAGSEVMSGVEAFLKGQGVRGISAAPRPVNTFDLFDANTWNGDSVMRSLAETLANQKLLAVKRSLPYILTEVQHLLPESGPEAVDAIRTLSENILILSKEGVSNSEIAVALFRKSQKSKK